MVGSASDQDNVSASDWAAAAQTSMLRAGGWGLRAYASVSLLLLKRESAAAAANGASTSRCSLISDAELGQTATEAAAEAERAAARDDLGRWVALAMPDISPALISVSVATIGRVLRQARQQAAPPATPVRRGRKCSGG
jgi:hypothetical protein